MADGLNDARAVRVTELVADYRNIQIYLSQMNVQAPAHDYNLPAYQVLRACIAEAQAILTQPFATTNTAVTTIEAQMVHLQGILTDAAVRRFRCQRAFLRASACIRWIQGRTAVLQGQGGNAARTAALYAVDQAFSAEITALTDDYIDTSLRGSDSSQGKWIAEDPPLAVIQQHL